MPVYDPTARGEPCNEAAIDTTPPWKRKLRARWQHIIFMCKIHTYHRFVYRHHMRLIHRFGWHWHTHLRPMSLPGENMPPEMWWCQWCGDRRHSRN